MQKEGEIGNSNQPVQWEIEAKEEDAQNETIVLDILDNKDE